MTLQDLPEAQRAEIRRRALACHLGDPFELTADELREAARWQRNAAEWLEEDPTCNDLQT